MELNPANRAAAGAASTADRRSTGNRGVFLIAVFDLIKAVLFLLAAVGVFHLVNRNTHVELTRLLHVFRLNDDHAIVRHLLVKANVITDPDKRILSEVLFLYVVLYAVEGIGLLLRKRWAEYFAVATTVIPLPFEVRTLFHHATHPLLGNPLPPDQAAPLILHSQVFVLKCAALIINVGIVWYLVYHLRRGAKPRRDAFIAQD